MTSISVSAIPLSELTLSERQTCNITDSRDCWSSEFNIKTNYYEKTPETGRTVEYHWRITNQTMALDGYERVVLAVNGQYPGPKLEANWGDWIMVHVTNELKSNGTGIHWHGVRMLHTPEADGAIGVTQCPIAPGDTYTYRWHATQYGTSWYHSHFSLQYSDGVVGPIVIHGPTSANWDIDLGPILLTDWFHKPASELANEVIQASTGLPPTADNGLINGKNKYDCALLGSIDPKCKNSGTRFETKFEAKKKHLLRIMNTGTDIMFKFSIDGHKMKVVSMDWVPIKPYETDVIFVAIGQRYDVIVEADAVPGDYWMRAVPQLSCFTTNTQQYNIRGIVRYDSTSTADPKSSSWSITDQCQEEDPKNLVPIFEDNVGSAELDKDFQLSLSPASTGGVLPVFQWTVNNNHYNPNTSAPTIMLINSNPKVEVPDSYSPAEVTSTDGWTYFVIQTNNQQVAHPFHLHGHDFYILGKGIGIYKSLLAPPVLDLTNPVRRDVALLPALGYLVIAFKNDNPGAWLMHCHIAWHLHMGLAIQVIERKGEVKVNRPEEIQAVCNAWKAYDKSNGADGA
ncbi:laccase 2 [Choiromyces venosus 120613-1]|uniref:Laccase 2 n=1 Tax=Choiromyces venosus 120613-1 TaxID=1336337 RepID=A0A3N4JQF1_9PEZI|nr:laccase 2 [Choiromyces venosus 120613-1]